MTSVKFGETAFGYNPPQHKIDFVTDFIDSVLRFNGEHWDDESGHMDYNDIRGKWFAELQERFPTVTGYSRQSMQKNSYPKTSPPLLSKPQTNLTAQRFPWMCAKTFNSETANNKQKNPANIPKTTELKC
jgi:hypothetical protein